MTPIYTNKFFSVNQAIESTPGPTYNTLQGLETRTVDYLDQKCDAAGYPKYWRMERQAVHA